MKSHRRLYAACLVATLAGLATPAARADLQTDVYRAIGVSEKNVVTSSILTASVIPGDAKQVVALTNFLTGKKDRGDAVGVRLDVFSREGGALTRVYSRDYGAERGGLVGRGELELLDLDRDGDQEVIVTFDDYHDPLVSQRMGEILSWTGSTFEVAWSGVMAYDATKDAREIPAARRDRWRREIDVPETLRTRGRTLFLDKTVLAVAGERLDPPKVVQETFPLIRPRPGR